MTVPVAFAGHACDHMPCHDKARRQDTPPPRRAPFRIPRLFRNWIGSCGVMLAGSAIFAFILLFAIDIFAKHANPYMGILAYVVAPAFFFSGSG